MSRVCMLLKGIVIVIFVNNIYICIVCICIKLYSYFFLVGFFYNKYNGLSKRVIIFILDCGFMCYM